jgi:glycerophosphoryl diester phosphodiesterase
MSGKGYLSPAKFKIFAHRGTTELGAQENTIEAFEHALACGADYLETDVQATKDRRAIIFHDSNLTRLLGISQKASALSLAEIRKLGESRGVQVPLLEDLLLKFPNARFNIDVKAQNAVSETVATIEKMSANNRVLVSSFSSKRRLAALRALPGVATSADSGRVLLLLVGTGLRSSRIIDAALAGLDALQIPTHAWFLRLDTSSIIEACHQRGVEVHYWTINDPTEAKRLQRLGADGIVTDRCKLMVLELTE